MEYADFHGCKLRSDEMIEITWSGEGSQKSHEGNFRVGDNNAPFDVLFGRNTLNSPEASACLTSNAMDPAAVLVQVKACVRQP